MVTDAHGPGMRIGEGPIPKGVAHPSAGGHAPAEATTPRSGTDAPSKPCGQGVSEIQSPGF